MGRGLVAALLWSILGLLFALPNLSSSNWIRPLLGSLAQWWAWGLVTPLIFRVDAYLPFKEKQLGTRILAQLLPSVALTGFYIYVSAAVRALLGLGAWNALVDTRLLSGAFRGGILWSWLVYWLIFGARQTYRYYEHYLASELRLERMERSFSQARLNALRMQLDPHFLFNALNTVSSQVERDPRLARSMIEHLGDLLRLSLKDRDRQEVPLAEEMGFRHGISRRASGGAVTVTAQCRAENFEIRITDDGVGLPPGWTLENSTGLGLSVTRERIAGLYPNGSSRLAVTRRTGGGTEVEISLPLRWTGEETNDRAAH